MAIPLDMGIGLCIVDRIDRFLPLDESYGRVPDPGYGIRRQPVDSTTTGICRTASLITLIWMHYERDTSDSTGHRAYSLEG